MDVRLHLIVEEDDVTRATPRAAEMKERISKVEAAIVELRRVLTRIERELKEFRAEMREQARQTSLILANHEGRIASLEDPHPSSS